MPFTSNDAHLPQRNARSFDLDDSAAKAAAWVWHLHKSNPGITTEGRFISSQSRRRSSGSYDRKVSRFQQEASTTTNIEAGGNTTETPMWDCGSNLYDTFELVAFGNQLDRSLMEVAPIRPPQAHLQEHHMKSPLHKPSGILRTLSLPRSLLRQTSKNCTALSSLNPDHKLNLSKAYNNGTRARSGEKASKKWSSMGKFMNVIKKVVVLHSFLGCNRSTNVIESSQRPLEPISKGKDNECTRDNQLLANEKVRGNLSTRNKMDDELSIQYTKVRSNSDRISNYKLSILSKDMYNYESNIGEKASMQKRVRAYKSASIGAMNKKIRSSSERMSDGLLESKSILRSRRKLGRDEIVCMDNRSNLEGVNVKERIKGSELGGVNVREKMKGANENQDLHKHLHHHHHHHHHHHYLHHNLGSESARLSPETMSHICAEQSWLI